MSKHLDLCSRTTIALRLDEGKSFAEIGKEIDKAACSVSREVRGHRIVSNKSGYGRIPNRCIHRKSCSVYDLCQECQRSNHPPCRSCKICNHVCPDFREEYCIKLQSPPYVCNGCPNRMICTLQKLIYDPSYAEQEYRATLSESREGFNLTERQVQEIDKLVSPLLRNGQSVHHIVVHHKADLVVSEQSIERLIDAGALSFKPEEQRRKYKIKLRKSKHREVKVDRKCRQGRSLEDYQQFMTENRNPASVQMDTVTGIIGGKCLFTLIFIGSDLMLAFLCDSNTAANIQARIDFLYDGLGSEMFHTLFPVILTDNGSEFTQPHAIEYDSAGQLRTHVFYCDPYASYQKGSVERNHEFIRLILPKGTSFDSLTQEDISLMMSHINSYSRPSLNDKSPYDAFAFLYGQSVLDKLMSLYSLSIVEPDSIVLTPALLSASLSHP